MGTPTSAEKCVQRARASAIGPSPGETDQIGFVQHRQHRTPRGDCAGYGVTVLGFDHFGGDIEDHFGVSGIQVVVRGHLRADSRRDCGAVQGMRHRGAPHTTTSDDGHPQRRRNPLAIAVSRPSPAPAANRVSSSTNV